MCLGAHKLAAELRERECAHSLDAWEVPIVQSEWSEWWTGLSRGGLGGTWHTHHSTGEHGSMFRNKNVRHNSNYVLPVFFQGFYRTAFHAEEY